MEKRQIGQSARTRELSPRQVAEAVGVSESSLKRWCDNGSIPSRRTAGGHRRIPIAGLVDFLRRKGFDAKRPDLLGLPAGAHRDGRTMSQVVPEFERALTTGDGGRADAILLGLYLAGHSIAEICDGLIAPTFHAIGRAWESEKIEIYQERRAVELTRHALHELSRTLKPAPAGAPLALSATLAGDPYTLAISMIEVVLRELGWLATSLGPNHPAPTLCAAIDQLGPRLVCVNVSWIEDEARLLSALRALHEDAREHRAALAIGGPALTRDIRQRIRYTAFCESMTELVGLAESLWHRPAARG